MAPPHTQSNPSTPRRCIKGPGDYSTGRRYRFFLAHEERAGIATFKSICDDVSISTPCGRKWLSQREQLGDQGWHCTRKLSDKLGRPERVSVKQVRAFVDPAKNPHRDEVLDAQIEYFKVDIKPRQLRKRLRRDTRDGRQYKQAFVQKVISPKNKHEQEIYSQEHQDKTITEFWAQVFFTDEAYIDPTSQSASLILRERGTQYNDENIQQRGEKKGTKWHISGWINWWGKSPKLTFYNDEKDRVEHPPMPPYPRRRPTTETLEEYQVRLKEWEAMKPHDTDIKVQGNAMTQKYYTDHLLPTFIDAIHIACCFQDEGAPWLLQEDGDPSHGMRKDGLAKAMKD